MFQKSNYISNFFIVNSRNLHSFIRNVATWWEIYHQFWFSISTSLGFWIQDGYLRKFHLKAFHNARRAWHIVSSSHLKRKYMFEKRTFSQVLCDKMSLKRNPIILVDNPLSWCCYTVKKSFNVLIDFPMKDIKRNSLISFIGIMT